MTTKMYTDINQSKKLTEILPIESADMHYNNVSIKGIHYVDEYRAELMEYNKAIKVLSKYTINPLFEVIPCWSLATLLEEIPEIINFDESDYTLEILKEGGLYYLSYSNILEHNRIKIESQKNFIDACYEMILKLHKLNLL